MNKFKNKTIESFKGKFQDTSYKDRNWKYYVTAKLFVAVSLIYSAFSSFGWYNTTINLSFEIRIVISVILSISIAYVIGHLLEGVVLSYFKGYLNWLQIMLLLPLMAFNVYTDWVGVNDSSKVITFQDQSWIENTATITTYEKQLTKALSWNDNGKKDWGLQAEIVPTQKTLETLYKERDRLRSELETKSNRLSNGLRGGVAAAMALIVGLTLWRFNYEYKCYLETQNPVQPIGSQLDSHKVEVSSQLDSHPQEGFEEVDLASEVERQLSNVNDADLQIAQVITDNPNVSLNKIAKELNLSRSKVQMINKQFNIR